MMHLRSSTNFALAQFLLEFNVIDRTWRRNTPGLANIKQIVVCVGKHIW